MHSTIKRLIKNQDLDMFKYNILPYYEDVLKCNEEIQNRFINMLKEATIDDLAFYPGYHDALSLYELMYYLVKRGETWIVKTIYNRFDDLVEDIASSSGYGILAYKTYDLLYDSETFDYIRSLIHNPFVRSILNMIAIKYSDIKLLNEIKDNNANSGGYTYHMGYFDMNNYWDMVEDGSEGIGSPEVSWPVDENWITSEEVKEWYINNVPKLELPDEAFIETNGNYIEFPEIYSEDFIEIDGNSTEFPGIYLRDLAYNWDWTGSVSEDNEVSQEASYSFSL